MEIFKSTGLIQLWRQYLYRKCTLQPRIWSPQSAAMLIGSLSRKDRKWLTRPCIWYICHTLPALFMAPLIRMLDTKWQHPWFCFHLSDFSEQDQKKKWTIAACLLLLLLLGPNKFKSSKKCYLLGQNTTMEFSGKPPLSSYETTLKQQFKIEKWDVELRHFMCFRLSSVVSGTTAREDVCFLVCFSVPFLSVQPMRLHCFVPLS